MDIQINTDNHIDGGEKFSEYVSGTVSHTLGHFSNHLTHVGVHFSDQNGSKMGVMDKRCLIEVRITGRKNAVVTSDANTIDEALSSSLDKMKNSIESTLGKGIH